MNLLSYVRDHRSIGSFQINDYEVNGNGQSCQNKRASNRIGPSHRDILGKHHHSVPRGRGRDLAGSRAQYLRPKRAAETFEEKGNGDQNELAIRIGSVRVPQC